MLHYLRATTDDLADWTELARKLWPEAQAEALRAELAATANAQDRAGLIVKTPEGEAVAFALLSLRRDYVPGATAYPVAYLEGLYVADAFRRQDVAKRLIALAEVWAEDMKCTGLASDALLENTQSQNLHRAAGFHEVERVVCFIKTLV